MKGILSTLGRLGRGFATKVGLAGVAGGVAVNVTAPAFALDPSVLQTIQAASALIAQISALVAAFGIGRKAVQAASE